MKAFFQSIIKGDIEKVKSYLHKKPELVHSTFKGPPKIDDGKSALQIAFCRGWFDIADYLIDQGADVNFCDDKSVNEWKAPVIHDAIRAAIFSSRYIGYRGYENTQEEFERAFKSLKHLVDVGANVNSVNSYGSDCLIRACMDSAQFTLNPKMEEDIAKVFDLLIRNGAVLSDKNRSLFDELYKHKEISKFIS